MKNISHIAAKSFALTAAVVTTFGVMAALNLLVSRRAERENVPEGDFVDVNGVSLHYVIRGEGRPVVLLHGNGSMAADFDCSGLLGECASRYRVVAFDRPGYGHSPRSSKAGTGPEEQADLIVAALGRLGIDDVVVVGHSWGTLVALQMALRHASVVKGLVLASGYYFPTTRVDSFLAAAGAVPGLRTLLSYTLTPLLARLTWPATVRNLFQPADVPEKFSAFPRELALRPSQLRTSAQEAALMVPSTKGLAKKCLDLSMPVALVCGAGDQVVDPRQSVRLSRRIFGSTILTLQGNGHMVHHTALLAVFGALAEVVQRADEAPAADRPQGS